MYCKNCGLKLDDNTNYCPQCGTDVATGKTRQTILSFLKAEGRLNRKEFAMCAVILLLWNALLEVLSPDNYTISLTPYIVFILVGVPSIFFQVSILIKRFHDFGKSAKPALLLFFICCSLTALFETKFFFYLMLMILSVIPGKTIQEDSDITNPDISNN